MKIPTTTVLSIALIATTLGAVSIPTINVNVTNFPLDEQGNLKVSVQETPLRKYKHSIHISLYESSTGFRGGNLAFSFNPNREFFNVTDFWVGLVAHSSYPGKPMDIILNQQATYSVLIDWNTVAHLWKIEDVSFYSAVVPYEINWIHLSSPHYLDISIFKVAISIEYEYLA